MRTTTALARNSLSLPFFSPAFTIALVLSLLTSATPTLAYLGYPGHQATERTTLGTWEVVYGIKITTTLYREDSQTFMQQQFQDGSQFVERLSKRGDRYYLPSGEYFVITKTENLNLYDSDGLIWSARPLK